MKPGQDYSPVSIAEYAKDEIRVLKELTWHYVIVRHELATPQRGQQRIIESLFNILLEAAHSRNHWKLFPAALQERLEEDSSRVAVVPERISHEATTANLRSGGLTGNSGKAPYSEVCKRTSVVPVPNASPRLKDPAPTGSGTGRAMVKSLLRLYRGTQPNACAKKLPIGRSRPREASHRPSHFDRQT